MLNRKNLEALNPDLTLELMTKVDEIIDRYRDKPGCLIPVLEECQETVGYLPVELQEYISIGLNIPGSTIYGVVTFYSFFSMVPKGRNTIKVCLGTACYVRGTKDIMKRLTGEFKRSPSHKGRRNNGGQAIFPRSGPVFGGLRAGAGRCRE